MATAALEIHLLGTFRLHAGDRPLTSLNKPRLQALLAYLLLHRAAPVPRARLAALFWPDTTDAQARTNLRNLLHALREALPPGDYLLADTQTVGWNPAAAVRLDVADFEAACAANDPAGLQAAVALYGGDLLPELYDDWAAGERDRLRGLLAGALGRLADRLESDGRHAEAIAAAARLLRLDPLREEFTIRLMRLNALAGDRAGVRRAYEALAAVLRLEVGVEPAAETTAAYHHWRDAPPAPRRPAARAALPLPADALFGRDDDVAAVAALVAQHRLVTLTGYGGVGKTRLALAAAVAGAEAEAFAEGVVWVNLAPLLESDAVMPAVAAALGLPEQAGRAPLATLVDHLGARRLLLVFDNCEHVLVGAGALIDALRRDCPAVHVLATSRLRLRLAGEHVFSVGALALPQNSDERRFLSSDEMTSYELRGESEASRVEWGAAEMAAVAANPCVQLFVDRATAVWPTFALTPANAPAVVHICRRLEGIPLAIELAAGRVRLLSTRQIAQRLDSAFDLLTAGPTQPLPHRTLRGVLDWSYNLLSGEEKTVLRRLAVMAGSFTLEAAELVAGGAPIPPGAVLELLAGLIDHSLVSGEEGEDDRRYRLHEMTRQYALEQLAAAGEREQVMARLLTFVGRKARRARDELRGERQAEWLRRLDASMANIETALEWGSRAADDAAAAETLRAVAELYFYWTLRGRQLYAARLTDRLLAAVAGRPLPPDAPAKAHVTAAALAIVNTDPAAAAEHLAAALADPAALDDAYTALAHHVRGLIAYIARDHATAEAIWAEALAATRTDWCRCVLLDDLGNVYMRLDRPEQALAVFQEERAVAARCGDRISRFYALTNLGIVLGRLEDAAQARAYADEAVRLARRMDSPRLIAYALRNQARLALAGGDAATAHRLLREATALAWEIRNRDLTLSALEQLALAAEPLRPAATVVALLSAVDAARAAFHLPPHPADEAATTAARGRLAAALSPAAYARAWDEGQRLDWLEVVALALEEV